MIIGCEEVRRRSEKDGQDGTIAGHRPEIDLQKWGRTSKNPCGQLGSLPAEKGGTDSVEKGGGQISHHQKGKSQCNCQRHADKEEVEKALRISLHGFTYGGQETENVRTIFLR